jgi:hypothetical protein
MRTIPFSKEAIVPISLAAAVPIAIAVATQLPFKQVFKLLKLLII